MSLRTVVYGHAADVVGWVLGVDGDYLVVLPTDSGPRWIRKDSIEARRTAPPRTVLPASNPLDLERVITHGWPGLERFRLGGWLLRSGAGWTGRANSCLVAGDPGMPTQEALAAVAEFYRHRGIEPRLQIVHEADGAPVGATRSPGPTPAEVDAIAGELGWRTGPETAVLVREATPDSVPALPHGYRVEWAEAPGIGWLDVFGRGAVTSSRAVSVLTAAPARYLTVLNGDLPVAVGRLAEAEDWAGLTGINTAAEFRGLDAARLVTELLLAAVRQPYVYVQVRMSDADAVAHFESLQFTVHHRYRYRALGS